METCKRSPSRTVDSAVAGGAFFLPPAFFFENVPKNVDISKKLCYNKFHREAFARIRRTKNRFSLAADALRS